MWHFSNRHYSTEYITFIHCCFLFCLFTLHMLQCKPSVLQSVMDPLKFRISQMRFPAFWSEVLFYGTVGKQRRNITNILLKKLKYKFLHILAISAQTGGLGLPATLPPPHAYELCCWVVSVMRATHPSTSYYCIWIVIVVHSSLIIMLLLKLLYLILSLIFFWLYNKKQQPLHPLWLGVGCAPPSKSIPDYNHTQKKSFPNGL